MISLRSSLVGGCVSTLSSEVDVVIIVIIPATQTFFEVAFVGYGEAGGFRCGGGNCGEGCWLPRVLETFDTVRSTVIKATT
jgi:hypothetical protein